MDDEGKDTTLGHKTFPPHAPHKIQNKPIFRITWALKNEMCVFLLPIMLGFIECVDYTLLVFSSNFANSMGMK